MELKGFAPFRAFAAATNDTEKNCLLRGGVGFAIRYIEKREEKRLKFSVQSLFVGQQRKSKALYHRCESLPKTEYEPLP